jgi:hypothetical protein
MKIQLSVADLAMICTLLHYTARKVDEREVRELAVRQGRACSDSPTAIPMLADYLASKINPDNLTVEIK